jgi:hypothetical protein
MCGLQVRIMCDPKHSIFHDNGSIPSHDLLIYFLCIVICSCDFCLYLEFYGLVKIACGSILNL